MSNKTELPTYEECRVVRNSPHAMTALQEFIYNEEPAAPDDVIWRKRLAAVIEEAKANV